MTLTPYWSDETTTLHLGDCLEVLPSIPDASVDSVVTDPPYGLAELSTATVLQAIAAWMAGDRDHVPGGPGGFMGRDWDKFVPPPGAWDECMRVLKPGGHLLAFAGSRTVDLMTLSIRVAGFEVRDSISWLYGSGWPKSPASLKPAHEPIVMARKPLATRNVAANVLEHGTGALNIGACRVEHAGDADLESSRAKNPGRADLVTSGVYGGSRSQQSVNDAGRWPPNVLLAHSADCRPDGTREVRNYGHHPATRGPGGIGASGHRGQEGLAERRQLAETVEAWGCAPGCPVAEVDSQSGTSTSTGGSRGAGGQHGAYSPLGAQPDVKPGFGDVGGASRFFPCFRYEAKAPASERPRLPDGTAWPTVKPLDLMRWLVRLVTPPGGTVLDPFAGSGTTGEACVIEGFPCVLIEKDPVAAELIKVRMSRPIQPDLFGGAA